MTGEIRYFIVHVILYNADSFSLDFHVLVHNRSGAVHLLINRFHAVFTLHLLSLITDNINFTADYK